MERSHKLHYLLAPLFYLAVAFAGRVFTARGVTDWYPEIIKPSYTPPGNVIGAVWTIIFILSAVSLIVFVNRGRGSKSFLPVIGIFVFNGIVNAAWSYLFFTKHFIGLAVIDALLILISVGLIIVLAWPQSKTTSILLVPYLLWVSFASYLTYAIYLFN